MKYKKTLSDCSICVNFISDNCDGPGRSQKGDQSLREDPHLPLSNVILLVAIVSFDVAMFVVVLFLCRAIWRSYNNAVNV